MNYFQMNEDTLNMSYIGEYFFERNGFGLWKIDVNANLSVCTQEGEALLNDKEIDMFFKKNVIPDKIKKVLQFYEEKRYSQINV